MTEYETLTVRYESDFKINRRIVIFITINDEIVRLL